MKREKLYKIGELIEDTGISRQTIHNYTVAGLIHESRRTLSGHRLYDEATFDRLEEIKTLQSKNYTLTQIKKIPEQQDLFFLKEVRNNEIRWTLEFVMEYEQILQRQSLPRAQRGRLFRS